MATTNISYSTESFYFLTATAIRGLPNPRAIFNDGDWLVSQHLWARLVELDKEGQPIPYLAKSWKRSVDGLTWTFDIPQHLKWSDGTPMTVDEIVESLKLSAKGTSHLAIGTYLKEIISNTSKHQIIFKLKKLPYNFLTALTFVDFSITKGPVNVTGENAFSGPYRTIKALAPEVKVEANPFFVGAATVKITPLTFKGGLSLDQMTLEAEKNAGALAYYLGDTLLPHFEEKLIAAKAQKLTTDNEWTAALHLGKLGLARLPKEYRQWLLRSLWESFNKEKDSKDISPVGIRHPLRYGALSTDEWRDAIGKLPSTKPKNSNFELEFLAAASITKTPSYLRAVATLNALGVKFKTLLIDLSKPDSMEFKKGRHGDYDLIFSYEGVSDPDPDTMWRYVMMTQYSSTKLVTQDQLDETATETDPRKREQKYKEFELRNVDDPFIIPLRVLNSKVFLKPPLTPPSGGHFDWGIQFWKFGVKH